MNQHPRHAPIVSSTTLPRESIETPQHAHIDVSLKNLRFISRRLVAFSAPYSGELQILERVYYKGKNQHRSALFWHKVVEIRRLGARILQVDIHGLVEGLRYSFYAGEARTSPKAFRGAWKHTPDVNACKSILERLRSVCLLLDQARLHFRLAYRTFARQLRTATFLPLVTALIAITSRLDFLVAELRSIITLYWETVVRILRAIDVTSRIEPERGLLSPPVPFSLPLSPAEGQSTATNTERPRKKAKFLTAQQNDEDLGNKVVRDFEPQSVTPTVFWSTQESSTEVAPPAQALSESTLSAVHSSEHTIVSAFNHHSHQASDGGATPQDMRELPISFAPYVMKPAISSTLKEDERSKPDAPEPARGLLTEGKRSPKVAKARRKKKRDEIDDIFGF